MLEKPRLSKCHGVQECIRDCSIVKIRPQRVSRFDNMSPKRHIASSREWLWCKNHVVKVGQKWVRAVEEGEEWNFEILAFADPRPSKVFCNIECIFANIIARYEQLEPQKCYKCIFSSDFHGSIPAKCMAAILKSGGSLHTKGYRP